MDQPTVGMFVKLKTGMLRINARTVQIVTEVYQLKPGEKTFDGLTPTAHDVETEGGYWVKTDQTRGEWWAWCHFRAT